MTTDKLIESYSPCFTDSQRAEIIDSLKSAPVLTSTMTTRQRLALFEHAIECGIAQCKKRDGYEYSFFHDVKTLADLRGWSKLKAALETGPRLGSCGPESIMATTCARCGQDFDSRSGFVTPNGLICEGCAEDEENEL